MIWNACFSSGDGLVCEQFIYAGTVSTFVPYAPAYILVDSDEDGMIPWDLEKKLKQANDPEYIQETGKR